MPQFDVHRTTGQNRASIPYVVVLQSRRFDAARTRLVAALRLAPEQPIADPNLTATFRIDGRDVLLDPLTIAAVARTLLRRLVGSLADDASSGAIINAIDAVITRAHG